MDFDSGSQQSVFDFIGVRKCPLHKRFDALTSTILVNNPNIKPLDSRQPLANHHLNRVHFKQSYIHPATKYQFRITKEHMGGKLPSLVFGIAVGSLASKTA